MDSLLLRAMQDVSQSCERCLQGRLRARDGPHSREARVVSPAALLPPYTVVEQSHEVRQHSRLLCWQAPRVRFQSQQLRRHSQQLQRWHILRRLESVRVLWCTSRSTEGAVVAFL